MEVKRINGNKCALSSMNSSLVLVEITITTSDRVCFIVCATDDDTRESIFKTCASKHLRLFHGPRKVSNNKPTDLGRN